MSSTYRIQWVDLCKGIAILLVVMAHFIQVFPSSDSILTIVANCGSRGPQLFFIISAFLTWASLSKQSDLTIKGYSVFVGSRLRRILPEYYLALGFSLVTFFGGLGYPQDVTWGGYISRLFLLNGFFPKYCNTILIVDWYVSNLMIFYLLAPLVKKFVNTFNKSLIFLLVSLLFSVVFHFLIAGIEEFVDYYSTLCFIVQLPVMALGIVLFYLCNGRENINIKEFIRVNLSVILLGISSVLINIKFGCISKSFLAGIVLVWICYTLAYVESNGIRLPSGILPVLGKYSLGIYLFHMFIIKMASLIPEIKWFSAGFGGWILSFVIITLISLGISKMTNKLSNKLISWIM